MEHRRLHYKDYRASLTCYLPFRKKFTFYLEELPAYYIVSYLLAIGFRQDAFHDSFSTI
ncbi:hypothetical protein BU23DRAFT_493200 [Bimuria novae-zelandiae CBS 107.79]|uniref:Uncharacterized protein n=1 Tax=Bimuria novae-zelandiae CBS 107.79 TaxID=1447943 RepID=A0A6A5UGD5_9PLEO|nr:hypothetical protein BU23DRAFT_493200 [Bimuria novae-zelandiae CBS 107.79]